MRVEEFMKYLSNKLNVEASCSKLNLVKFQNNNIYENIDEFCWSLLRLGYYVVSAVYYNNSL